MSVLAGALNLVFPLPPTDDKPPEGDKFKKGRMATVKLTTVHSPRIGSIEELLRGEVGRPREEKPSSGGALHKAKKHLKTLMSGGSKRYVSSVRDLVLMSTFELKFALHKINHC